MLGSEPRDSKIKGVCVSAGIVGADIRIGEMLIPISHRYRLPRFAKDLNTSTKVNRVHELRTLRRQYPIVKVNEPTICGQERLHATLWKKGSAKANRAYAASITPLSLCKAVLRSGVDFIQHGQCGHLGSIAKVPRRPMDQ